MPLSIAVLLGTGREGRQSTKVFSAIKKVFQDKGVEVVSLDIKELDIPMFDDQPEKHSGVVRMCEAFKECDGLVIVTPEYNHSLPGPLKCALDFAHKGELSGKPAAIVSVSKGPYAGVRMMLHLENVLLDMGTILTKLSLPTPNVIEFDEQNPPVEWLEKAEMFAEKTIAFFNLIKVGKATL